MFDKFGRAPSVLPVGGAVSNIPAEGIYIVVAGDTFAGIAQRFGFTVPELLLLNRHVVNTSSLQVGQAINVRRAVSDPIVVSNSTTDLAMPVIEKAKAFARANPLMALGIVGVAGYFLFVKK